VGLGTMGAGIAEVFARSGARVLGVDQTSDLANRGRGHLERSTDRAVRRGKLSDQDRSALLNRVLFSTDVTGLAGCDLVVEAAVERLDIKQAIFAELDSIVGSEAVLATNTSSLSVTAIAAATARPERVVGMHFFNPAPVQSFLEVVSTVLSAPEVVDDVAASARSVGKHPVIVGDRAGFLANTLLFGYLNAAATLHDQGAASREDIDAAMRLGCGYPMGPLELLDLIGLDTAVQILLTMYDEGHDRLHAPAAGLRRLVAAGMLGRKSGRGFYRYDDAGRTAASDDAAPRGTDAEPRPIGTVGVIGAGSLASALGAAFAAGGFAVLPAPDAPADDTWDQLAHADLVVEALPDDLAAKTALFARLGATCRAGTILATTTSALSVSMLAGATSRPQDVIGLHVVHPDAVTRLVEVVSTALTAPAATRALLQVCRSIGAAAVCCDDRAGRLVDRLLSAYLNDAVTMLQSGYASADDIDLAMREGCALPTGPFELLDHRGLDVVLAAQHRLFAESHEPGHAPAPLLAELVAMGQLGRSTGRGFRAHRR
jgi:3-hydroxybutyryl-CoA dehydrogenase